MHGNLKLIFKRGKNQQEDLWEFIIGIYSITCPSSAALPGIHSNAQCLCGAQSLHPPRLLHMVLDWKRRALYFIGLQKHGQRMFHEESASSYPKNRFFLPRKQVPRQEPPAKDPLAPGHVAMVAQSPWWQIQGRTMERTCRWHYAQRCSGARREPDSMCHTQGLRPTHQKTAHTQEAGVVANARAGGQGCSDGNLWTGGNH